MLRRHKLCLREEQLTASAPSRGAGLLLAVAAADTARCRRSQPAARSLTPRLTRAHRNARSPLAPSLIPHEQKSQTHYECASQHTACLQKWCLHRGRRRLAPSPQPASLPSPTRDQEDGEQLICSHVSFSSKWYCCCCACRSVAQEEEDTRLGACSQLQRCRLAREDAARVAGR